jgi:hypothetical protein
MVAVGLLEVLPYDAEHEFFAKLLSLSPKAKGIDEQ